MKETLKKNLQRVVAGALVVILALELINTEQVTTLGADRLPGMIYSTDKNNVITKTTADPNGARANELLYGKPVTVLAEVTGTDGMAWYQIQYDLKAGGSNTAYAPKANVLLDSAVTVQAPAYINAVDVKFRNDAGTDRTIILASLNPGHVVEILDNRTLSDGIWQRVRTTINGEVKIGWVYGQYVTVDESKIETDAAYEAALVAKGFPQSYVKSLAILHAKYPNWVFEPVITGLDWETVIANESVSKRNLVPITDDDAKKSTADGEYSWVTNMWTAHDTGEWVTAHPDFIRYCMDPRNFLNETDIFMFETLRYSEGQNVQGVYDVLNGSFMTTDVIDRDGSTLNYSNALYNIGKTINVSPYHLAARVRQEQGVKGSSVLISGTYAGYEGYYNYFNIGASGNNQTEVILNGLKEAKTEGWTTRYLALAGGAKKLADKYVNIGQDTLYFQKFNVVYKPGLYWKQYMQNIYAAYNEGRSMSKAYSDKTQAFTFRIPVYTGMREEKYTFTVSGNRNNYLSRLTVSGVPMSPSFSGSNTTYSMVVGNEVANVTVSATAVAGTSTITGTGNYNLAIGSNTIKVNCKSQSGDTKTYVINLFREGDNGTKYTLNTSTYTVGTYISGVDIGTTASTFLANISCKEGSVKLLKSDGSENTGKVGTGNYLAIYVDGVLVATKSIMIYGDTNGDGNISLADLVRVNRQVLKLSNLSGVQFAAADINKDGKVSLSDLVKVNRHILNLTAISQK